MVNDILSISKCGKEAIEKTAVINSFLESERLTLSKAKSNVAHIGNASKCKQKCPTLKVHADEMLNVKSTKYLGNYIIQKDGVKQTIEERRKKGWGLISKVKAILDEVPMGSRRIEARLLLRRTWSVVA